MNEQEKNKIMMVISVIFSLAALICSIICLVNKTEPYGAPDCNQRTSEVECETGDGDLGGGARIGSGIGLCARKGGGIGMNYCKWTKGSEAANNRYDEEEILTSPDDPSIAFSYTNEQIVGCTNPQTEEEINRCTDQQQSPNGYCSCCDEGRDGYVGTNNDIPTDYSVNPRVPYYEIENPPGVINKYLTGNPAMVEQKECGIIP